VVEVGSLLTRALEVATVLKMEGHPSSIASSSCSGVCRAARVLLPLPSRCCRGRSQR
jgi:hypothetical protein